MSDLRLGEWPVGERPRERLLEQGPASLTNRELVAILVGSGSVRRSAIGIAADVLAAGEGSLRRLAAVLSAKQRIAAVGPVATARISAALELGRRLAREGPLERERVQTPRDVYDRCAPALRDLVQEEFRVLLLNTQHAVLRELVITRGTIDGSLIHAREVFRPAIAESATSVILVHNHPSGDPEPSPDDRAITAQLAEAGRIMGIPILDHVIIGDGQYVSFVEKGFLERRF
jgi:DNA repair protein RadC